MITIIDKENGRAKGICKAKDLKEEFERTILVLQNDN